MLVLGLSAHAPDAAAALVRDGRPLAAAREELFTNVRSEQGFPRRAVRFCLQRGGVAAEELDAVVFFAKPLRKFERELSTRLQAFPSGGGAFAKSMFRWLGERLWMRNEIVAELGVEPEKILFAEHHQALAASAFLTSPFEEAAILTTGPDGEWATTALTAGRAGAVEVQREIHHPHGLARLCEAVARFLALDPAQDESKWMALAGYGEPRFAAELQSLVAIRPDGSFALAEPLAHREAGPGDVRELARLFGAPRASDEPLLFGPEDRRHADVARSLREVLVEVHLALLGALVKEVPSRNLCLGGALARDPGLAARLAAEGPFENVFVDPAGGNAGAALGAALLAAGANGPPPRGDGVDWLRLGPPAAGDAAPGARELPDDQALIGEAARRLAEGQVAGWLWGSAELAGRSLGGRAILADARSAGAAERIRREVKRREPYVPFGALVPAERLAELFDVHLRAAMTVERGTAVARVREGARAALAGIAHADGSTRVLSVSAERDPVLHGLLTRFGQATGTPVLLHTTLRLHGEPMVKSEAEGLRLLGRSRLDFLVVERRVYGAG
jgi:carbamoyltransferase